MSEFSKTLIGRKILVHIKNKQTLIEKKLLTAPPEEIITVSKLQIRHKTLNGLKTYILSPEIDKI